MLTDGEPPFQARLAWNRKTLDAVAITGCLAGNERDFAVNTPTDHGLNEGHTM
jgi:hypothetical protein